MDRRQKYPWQEWQDGAEHVIPADKYGKVETVVRNIYRQGQKTETFPLVSVEYGAQTMIRFQFYLTLEDYNDRHLKGVDRDDKGRFAILPEPDWSHLPPEAFCTFPGCGAKLSGNAQPYKECGVRRGDDFLYKHR